MLGGSRALAALLGFVAVALVARSLGPAELGLLSMALAVFGWAQHAAECGLRSVVTAETGWRRAFLPLLSTYMILRMSCAAATATVTDAFLGVLGPDRVILPPRLMASEDFSDIAEGVRAPYTYWLFGGADPAAFAAADATASPPAGLPVNHSPHYAPMIQPTLDTGTAALVAAALAWLAP